MTAKIAVIYYSATGAVHALAQAVAEGATSTGAEVRLRRIAELPPDAPADTLSGTAASTPNGTVASTPNGTVASTSDGAADEDPRRRQYAEAARTIPLARIDDLAWADAIAFGTPTRFGTPAAELKRFIDQAGALWQEGGLAGKPVTAFTSAYNRHGGSEATLLSLANVFYHWGALIVPPGYTDPSVYAAGGNPYGTAAVTGPTGADLLPAATQAAHHQGHRLARTTLQLLTGTPTLTPQPA